jgi:hypothetical protein
MRVHTPLLDQWNNNWQSSHQKVFGKFKKGIKTEITVFFWYTDLNKSFHLYTNASDQQLRVVTMHNRKPLENTAEKQYKLLREKQRVFIVY